MPDLGPLGRGGARRRTRRRMAAVNEMQNSKQEHEPSESSETVFNSDSSEKLIKLAKLLKDKGVITETEYNLIFE
ncbi:MAG: hypothetical protein Q8M97_11540 [Methanobacteriaceae archaeon]|nr:hypothetical protein [Methanobacteriaceae archaeon]MDP3623946.1 hypothetical protein [Methanobacteriaceae archaeon]